MIPDPINVLEFVLALNPTFVARTFSGNIPHMTEMIMAGIEHQGFAFIDIAQACPTYNRGLTHEWYLDHIVPIETLENYDPYNMGHAR